MTFLKGLFDKNNYNLMGDSFIIDPGFATGTEPNVYDQILGNRVSLNAIDRFNSTHSIITCTATPIESNGILSHVNQSICHLGLSFISGKSSFGTVLDAPLLFPPGIPILSTITQEIYVDCHNAIISLPSCTEFNIKFRHRAVNYSAYVPGRRIAVRNRVNIGYAYGTPKSIACTYTDIPVDTGVNGGGVPRHAWAKPQFAEALSIRAQAIPGEFQNFTGFILLTFFGSELNTIKTCRYSTPFSSFPLIQWPQDAWYVVIDSSNLTNPNPGIVGITVCPVHAIRL